MSLCIRRCYTARPKTIPKFRPTENGRGGAASLDISFFFCSSSSCSLAQHLDAGLSFCCVTKARQARKPTKKQIHRQRRRRRRLRYWYYCHSRTTDSDCHYSSSTTSHSRQNKAKQNVVVQAAVVAATICLKAMEYPATTTTARVSMNVMQTPPRTPTQSQKHDDYSNKNSNSGSSSDGADVGVLEHPVDALKQKQQYNQQIIALENDRSKLMVLYHAATCPYEGVPGNSKMATDRNTSGSGNQDGSPASSNNTFATSCCPTHPHCCASKRLFGHMITCVRGNMCDVPGCQHARSVWKHYRKCPHRIIAQCGLCNAVPQAYNSKTLCERFRASNSTNSARTTKNLNASISGSGGGTGGGISRSSYSSTRNHQEQRRQFTTPTFQVDRNQNVPAADDGRQQLQYHQHHQHYHQTDEEGQLYSSDMLFQGDEKIVGMLPPAYHRDSVSGNYDTPLGSSTNSNRPDSSRIVTPDSTTEDHNNKYGRESYHHNGNEKRIQTAVFRGEQFDDGGMNQQNSQRSWRIQKGRTSSIAARGEYYAIDSATVPPDEQEERASYTHQRSVSSSVTPSTGKQRGRNFLSKMNPRSSRRGVNSTKDQYSAQETDHHNSSYQEEYSSSNQQQQSRMRGPLRRFAV